MLLDVSMLPSRQEVEYEARHSGKWGTFRTLQVSEELATSAQAALLQRFVLDERADDVEQLLLGLGVELFDSLEPPLQRRTQCCLGGPLGRRYIAEQLIGAHVQRAIEIGDQVRRRGARSRKGLR